MEDIQIDVLEVKRSSSDGLTTLTFKMTNNGSENLHASPFISDTYEYRDITFSGVSLLAEEEQIRHHPVIDAENFCLCAGYSKTSAYEAFVEPNESIDYWVLYHLPEDLSKVTVEVPGFDPIKDVPIS